MLAPKRDITHGEMTIALIGSAFSGPFSPAVRASPRPRGVRKCSRLRILEQRDWPSGRSALLTQAGCSSESESAEPSMSSTQSWARLRCSGLMCAATMAAAPTRIKRSSA